MKIIEKLSTYAALLGVIGAIGGGFYTWGQFNSRLDAIESTPSVNLRPLKEMDKELMKKVDDALLYANEYKVDLIDRIDVVEEKSKPQDMTWILKEFIAVKKQIDDLDIPESTNLTPVYSQISNIKETLARIKIPSIEGLKKDIKEIKAILSELEKQVAIVAKENELQDIQLEEVKALNSNPLGG